MASAHITVGPELIPANAAVLCMDCGRISASSGNCLGCGSAALLSLVRVLDPPAQKPIHNSSSRQAARRALEIHYRRAAQQRMEA